jgi:hypothetical protein
MREALIKIFKKPIPDSYKAGREVMQGVLGCTLTDEPALCFSSNLLLAALTKQGTSQSPCVWQTNDKFKVGYASVLQVRTTNSHSAGHALLMDFIGMIVHTKYKYITIKLLVNLNTW